MGEKLEIIGSYLEDCPVFLYKKELFERFKEKKKLNDFLNPVWKNWTSKFDSIGRGYKISEEDF